MTTFWVIVVSGIVLGLLLEAIGETLSPLDQQDELQLRLPFQHKGHLTSEEVWFYAPVKYTYCTVRGIWPFRTTHRMAAVPVTTGQLLNINAAFRRIGLPDHQRGMDRETLNVEIPEEYSETVEPGTMLKVTFGFRNAETLRAFGFYDDETAVLAAVEPSTAMAH
jgi:hypothetical protein